MSPSFALHVTDVAFARPASPPLFEALDLHLTPGWTGVVGPNGAGKTTLLELIAGRLAPTTGRIRRVPAGLTVALCPQRVDACTDAIRQFSWDWARRAVLLRADLELDPEAIERWPTLSPGERKRWQVGAALADRPGALLLDEPTNHLDADGRARLVEALRRFDGIGLLVAHDRALLDELTEATLWVEGGRVERIRAPYSVAAAERAAARAGRVAALEARQADARAAKARLADARRRAETDSARRKRQVRDRRDRDARGAAAKDRAAHGAAKGARQMSTLRATAEAADRAAVHDLRAGVGRGLFVDHDPAPFDPLAVLDAAEVRARGSEGAEAGEGPVILRGVRLAVRRGDRIRITGANGAGKTTLLSALRRAARVPEARALFVPQHLPAGAGIEALDAVRALPPDERGRVMQLVAALGVEPDRLLASARPSPGEVRKLVLARGLARRPWWVVLDEPGNHLDLPSIERLQAALAEFPGAMLLVSHDAVFAEALTDIEWRVAGGRVTIGRAAAHRT